MKWREDGMFTDESRLRYIKVAEVHLFDDAIGLRGHMPNGAEVRYLIEGGGIDTDYELLFDDDMIEKLQKGLDLRVPPSKPVLITDVTFTPKGPRVTFNTGEKLVLNYSPLDPVTPTPTPTPRRNPKGLASKAPARINPRLDPKIEGPTRNTWVTTEGHRIYVPHLSDGHLLGILGFFAKDYNLEPTKHVTYDSIMREAVKRGIGKRLRAQVEAKGGKR